MSSNQFTTAFIHAGFTPIYPVDLSYLQKATAAGVALRNSIKRVQGPIDLGQAHRAKKVKTTTANTTSVSSHDQLDPDINFAAAEFGSFFEDYDEKLAHAERVKGSSHDDSLGAIAADFITNKFELFDDVLFDDDFAEYCTSLEKPMKFDFGVDAATPGDIQDPTTLAFSEAAEQAHLFHIATEFDPSVFSNVTSETNSNETNNNDDDFFDIDLAAHEAMEFVRNEGLHNAIKFALHEAQLTWFEEKHQDTSDNTEKAPTKVTAYDIETLLGMSFPDLIKAISKMTPDEQQKALKHVDELRKKRLEQIKKDSEAREKREAEEAQAASRAAKEMQDAEAAERQRQQLDTASRQQARVASTRPPPPFVPRDVAASPSPPLVYAGQKRSHEASALGQQRTGTPLAPKRPFSLAPAVPYHPSMASQQPSTVNHQPGYMELQGDFPGAPQFQQFFAPQQGMGLRPGQPQFPLAGYYPGCGG